MFYRSCYVATTEMASKDSRYNILCKLYRELYPDLKGNAVDTKVKTLYWDPHKKGDLNVDDSIKELKEKVAEKKKKILKSTLFYFCSKPTTSSSTSSSTASSSAIATDNSSVISDSDIKITADTTTTSAAAASTSFSSDIQPPSTSSKPTPAQDKVIERINVLRADILAVEAVHVLTPALRLKLAKDKKELKQKEKDLSVKQRSNERSKKAYSKKKEVLKRAAQEKLEDITLQRYATAKVGRPSIDEIQPGIIDCLKQIVSSSICGADGRRRSEVLRTVRTLDDLHKAVEDMGYSVSRTGLYYQLLPRDGSTIEGKRHHSLLKVRLLKAQNTERAHHPDRDFCFQTHLMVQVCVYIISSVYILSFLGSILK